MSEEMRVEYVPLADLRRWPSNPKTHDTEAIEASMRRFGFTSPILVDETTGRIAAGHGRAETLARMRDAGEAVPARVYVRETDGEWLVPVLRGIGFPEGDGAAYVVADNRTTELGGWDDRKLAEILEEADQSAGGLEAIGFSDEELDRIMATASYGPGGEARTAAEAEAALKEEDAAPAPAPPAEPVARQGDVWKLGDHLLACGDCGSDDVRAALLGDDVADLILTDPPYCSGGFQEAGRSQGSIGTRAQVKQIANDTLSTRGYLALLQRMLETWPAKGIYAFTDWRQWVNLFDLAERNGYGCRAMIVWDKETPGMGVGWRTQHELILYGVREKVTFDRHKEAVGNVIRWQRTGNKHHSTEKPVGLLEKFLQVSYHAETVVDPFTGSGPTLLAAHRKGRRFLGAELDPAYCDVVIQRWEEETGGKAKRKRKGKK